MALAQASGSDLARAAEVAGSTLRAFGMDAIETGRVTDGGIVSSALDEYLPSSMKFVAPVAKAAGMSLEETSAMLAVLATTGSKVHKRGRRCVVSFRNRRIGQTYIGSDCRFSGGLNLADAKDEVGRSAQSALLVLAQGVDQIAPTTKAFEQSAGAAKEMADIMGDNAFGAGKRLESAMEGLGISIGEIVAQAIVPMVEGLAKLAGKLNSASPATKKFVVVLGAFAAAAGPALFLTGGMIRNFKFLRIAVKRSTIAKKAAAAAMRVLNLVMKANPIGLVITAVTALAAAFYLLNKRKKKSVEIDKKLSDGAQEEIASNQTRLNQANNLIDTIKDQNISNDQRRLISKLNTEYKDLLPNLIDEKDSVDDIATAQKEMNKQMAKKIAMIAAQDEMNQAVQDAVEAQKLFNNTVKQSDTLAEKSQELFGRVLSAQDVKNYKNSLRSLTKEKADLVQEIDLNNTMLAVNKKRLDDANEAVTEVGKSVDELANKLNTLSEDGGDDIETFTESLVDLPRKSEAAFIGFMPMMENVRHQMVNFTALAIQAGNAVKDVFAASIRDAFGELEKGETRMGKFKESMGRMLKDMIVQFLAAATAAFLLAVAIRFALGGIGPGGFDIASGLASIGNFKDIFGTMQMAGGFMPNIPMLAEGGIVTGPTLAMIGEGAQSEAVIPLDRLHEFGGGGKVEVVGRISGADILLSNERAQRNRTRQRGF